MNSTELSTVFNIGDIVVYPLQGVGEVLSIEDRKGREYLRIGLHGSKMDILLPLDNANNLGLRHLESADAVKSAIESLSKNMRHSSKTDWKERLNENQNLMKEGSIANVASVVCSLYHRSKIKDLPALEKRLYDSALSMLVDESSSVLGISIEEMKRQIFSVLEPQCSEFQILQ